MIVASLDLDEYRAGIKEISPNAFTDEAIKAIYEHEFDMAEAIGSATYFDPNQLCLSYKQVTRDYAIGEGILENPESYEIIAEIGDTVLYQPL